MTEDATSTKVYSCGCQESHGQLLLDCSYKNTDPAFRDELCARRYFAAKGKKIAPTYRCCEHCAPMCTSRHSGHPVACREACSEGKQVFDDGSARRSWE